MNSTTQAQKFAAEYAANMAEQMLATIRRVRQAATAIMLIAMVVSYTHQAGYLASIGTPFLGAWLIPGALDALTFLCVKVLGTPGMAQPAKSAALKVLAFPVLASGSINFLGPGQLVTKIVFVLAVLMIPAAELVASKIKPDFEAMAKLEQSVAPAPVVDEELQAKRSAAARKAAATRKRNAAAKSRKPRAPKAVEIAELETAYAMPEAPVSPAA